MSRINCFSGGRESSNSFLSLRDKLSNSFLCLRAKISKSFLSLRERLGEGFAFVLSHYQLRPLTPTLSQWERERFMSYSALQFPVPYSPLSYSRSRMAARSVISAFRMRPKAVPKGICNSAAIVAKVLSSYMRMFTTWRCSGGSISSACRTCSNCS